MRLMVFAVYDSKVAAFFHPFYAPHLAVAKRAFTATANDPESQMYAHPQDFTLFELGVWLDDTGVFETHSNPINHGLAAAYKVKDHGQGTPQSLRDEAHVLRGSEGGDPA